MSESVSVLVIGPTPPPAHGVSVATEILLRARHDERLNMLHLEIADRRGIQHVDKPDLHDVWLFCGQWLRLAWLMVWHRPRVVYLSMSQATVGIIRDGLFVALARLLGSRTVIHLHGSNLPTWFRGRGPLLRAFVRWIVRGCTTFIILDETFRESLRTIVPAWKIVVVPNGVPLPTVACREVRRQDPKLRVLFLSTLSRAKGVLVLIDAVAQLARHGVPVELTLAGPWLRDEDRAAAMQAIAGGGLDRAVRLTGPVEGAAKADLYQWADVFVFPGIQQEGQPLVVIEAMAAGLPVLCSDRGCLAATVPDGECGLRVRVGDSADLAEKIAWLSARPDERGRMGENSRRRYLACFSESQFVANMTAVLLAAGTTADRQARQQDTTLDYFNRVAVRFQANYAHSSSFRERRRVWERVIRDSLAEIGPAALCLDMGCGDGRLGQIAAAAGMRTVGIDQSGEMLTLARARAVAQGLDTQTEYVQAPLPLPQDLVARYRGQASLILCSSVLEYIDSYEEVLGQFRELLRSEGRLIVSVPNGRSIYRWAERLLGWLNVDRDSYLRYQRHVFDPRAFRERMQQLGYAAIHEEYFAWPLRVPSTFALARRGTHAATLYLVVAERLPV